MQPQTTPQPIPSTPQPNVVAPQVPSTPQPVQPQQQPTMATKSGMFSGRLNRIGFLMSAVYIFAILLIPVIFILLFRSIKFVQLITILLGVVVVLLSIPVGISTEVRRWHDMDQSGLLVLLGFIPFIGPILFIVYLFFPGTNGPNKYGEPDTRPSSIKKVLFGK